MYNHRPVNMMVPIIVVLLTAATVTCKTDEKRLVLHSDDDMLQALASLKAEFQAYKTNSSQQIAALEIKLTDSSRYSTLLETNFTDARNTFTKQISELTNTITVMQTNSSKGLHSTYVRWGRNVCPGNGEFVYRGYIAGKHNMGRGSGTDALCLPTDPTWLKYHDGNDALRAHIFGSEIDIYTNVFYTDVNQMDMPCAVCRIPKATSIMIPARNNCYPGWSLEYNGYLMAGLHSRDGAYKHICMDLHPEFVPHGGTNDDQHILYVVEAQCGSLPCPPYVQGRELACAVCSK